MAPTRSKKRKSTESITSVDMPEYPAPPQMVPTKMHSPHGTPSNRSPTRKLKMGITMAQKQALIDNLQLEIAERARKLRAQYMLQAQGLRSRIEIRVNRTPTALRKAKMGDLLIKYSQPPKEAISGPLKSDKIRALSKNILQAEQGNSRACPSSHRGQKRTSDDMSTDKENQGIEVPKKRVKGESAMPLAKSTSRMPPSPSVLSSRSANSRTFPRSPIKPASPQKSFLARPISPIKPTAPVPAGGILTSMVEKAKSTRNAAVRKVTAPKEKASTIGRGRRAVAAPSAPPPSSGRVSDSSDASAGTVITRKLVPAPIKKAPVKKSVMGTLKGMASQKKVPVAVKPATASSPAGGRVLRKRN